VQLDPKCHLNLQIGAEAGLCHLCSRRILYRLYACAIWSGQDVVVSGNAADYEYSLLPPTPPHVDDLITTYSHGQFGQVMYISRCAGTVV
jgi:hypothetical protein